MARTGKRIRRKRVRSSRGSKSGSRPKRIIFVLGAVLVGVAVAVLLIVYAPAAYNSWRETRLLKQANEMLREEDFSGATRVAHEVLKMKGDSLPAFTILAEATEKENQQETVAWRAQIARMLPHDLDSHLNLVSAALRFGQLDVARKALETSFA